MGKYIADEIQCRQMWSYAFRNPHYTYTMGKSQLKESTEEKDLGVIVHKSLKVASQCAAAANKGNRTLG